MDKERRKHKRGKLPPLFIKLTSHKCNKLIPGIIMDISAGGMAVLTYEPYEIGAILSFDLSFLKGILPEYIEGKIVRIEEKREIFLIGVLFTNIDNKSKNLLDKLSNDFHNCSDKWLRSEKMECNKSCSFYKFCLGENSNVMFYLK